MPMHLNSLKRLSLVFVMLLVSQQATTIKAQSYNPQVGEPHADFALPDIATGELRRLSDFRGKKVLLIHFASW